LAQAASLVHVSGGEQYETVLHAQSGSVPYSQVTPDTDSQDVPVVGGEEGQAGTSEPIGLPSSGVPASLVVTSSPLEASALLRVLATVPPHAAATKRTLRSLRTVGTTLQR
jgi:hypothetical protein